MSGPLELLGCWLEDAEAAGVPGPRAMTLATATAGGRPSARLVSLKRISGEALVFTTALWTRKVEELRSNPRVAATFYWPPLGRQARIEGRAEIAARDLAEELFAGRPRSHQLQAHVSRQGEEIEGLDELRARLEALRAELGDDPVPCPEDWGAVRVVPDLIEFWEEGEDRLHCRRLYEANGAEWREVLLAP
jgi:pyridoxamine 5'-phosphate oxidase